ncbi:MAG: AMP-binding protein, partial [Planctomycetes bacterium]|nr:AMP-binding protein [Planctomycetota bacterium]
MQGARPLILPGSGRQNPFPLSFAQEQLWFLDQLEPGNPFYNIATVLRFRGPLDESALRRALEEVGRRHESLRTTFRTREGRPAAWVSPPAAFELPVTDLSPVPPEEREERALALAREEGRRSFDLAQGPLWRTTLVRLGPEEHLLLLVVHHIVADGWSVRVLVREVAALYEAFVTGRPASLPELPLQYSDHARWQQQFLEGQVLRDQLTYWKQRLAGAPTTLELPADQPRPAVQTFRGARQPFTLVPGLVERLRFLGRQEGCTLYMVLLAAFQTLLHRYTGQEDICVGSPIAGRTRAQTEGLVGFFVNTLVLRADLSGDPSFRQLLQRVRETALGAYAHQDLPFEKLVQELQPERDLSHSPLFQVLFVFNQHPDRLAKVPGVTLDVAEVDTGTAKFDLSMYLTESPESLSGYMEYNTDLFEPATMARWVGHWRTLLEGLAAHPESRLGDLPLLTSAESRTLLVDWNDTRTSCPPSSWLADRFEEQARRTPDQVALVFGEQSITYRELNRQANQLAHCLQALGVGPDVLVGLCLERSPLLVTGLLGILKAGGAYVPLDPAYPAERLAFMLEDARAPVLLTQQSLAEQLPAGCARRVCLDREEWEAGRQGEENPARTVAGSHLAYVLYTSGSTGRPKGVAIEHQGVASLLDWAHQVFADDELTGVLASTSLCFDISVFELFVPLCRGGRVILAENALALPRLPAGGEVTLINTVPSAMAELLRLGGVPPSVRTVNLAGEALSLALAERVYQQETIERLYNLYGPTET